MDWPGWLVPGRDRGTALRLARGIGEQAGREGILNVRAAAWVVAD